MLTAFSKAEIKKKKKKDVKNERFGQERVVLLFKVVDKGRS